MVHQPWRWCCWFDFRCCSLSLATGNHRGDERTGGSSHQWRTFESSLDSIDLEVGDHTPSDRGHGCYTHGGLDLEPWRCNYLAGKCPTHGRMAVACCLTALVLGGCLVAHDGDNRSNPWYALLLTVDVEVGSSVHRSALYEVISSSLACFVCGLGLVRPLLSSNYGRDCSSCLFDDTYCNDTSSQA